MATTPVKPVGAVLSPDELSPQPTTVPGMELVACASLLAKKPATVANIKSNFLSFIVFIFFLRFFSSQACCQSERARTERGFRNIGLHPAFPNNHLQPA